MTALEVIGALSPVGAAATVYVSWKLGQRHATVEERQVATEEREAALAATDQDWRIGAQIRQELREALAASDARVAALTTDNVQVHKRMHDLANEMMVMQGNLIRLEDERAECRRDLNEVLFAVNALTQGRDALLARLSALEDDA